MHCDGVILLLCTGVSFFEKKMFFMLVEVRLRFDSATQFQVLCHKTESYLQKQVI